MGALDNETKRSVVKTIAKDRPLRELPKDKVRVGESTVHVRCTTKGKGGGETWSFNINPNTLSAQYELWICGTSERFYLVPIQAIKDIYNDPNSYSDSHHKGIQVLDINTRTHECLYGRGGLKKDFSGFFRGSL